VKSQKQTLGATGAACAHPVPSKDVLVSKLLGSLLPIAAKCDAFELEATAHMIVP
jgi:hypothetical protein